MEAAKRKTKKPKTARRIESKRLAEADQREIVELARRCVDEAPQEGSNPLDSDDAPAPTNTKMALVGKKFEDLPISQRTLTALTKSGFTHLTEIQRAGVPHALCGRDVLGAARTGSGKTLAFLVPMLERLYRSGVGGMEGLAALVISPTRELAVQIFEVLISLITPIILLNRITL
jgi:ATP-dependent RNA helicase DDX10/DBP4